MTEAKELLKAEKAVNERLKYEIAQELGLLDKVSEGGWKSLTARESGRIGGMLASKKKKIKNEGKKK